MASSVVEICNRALDAVGSQTILSLDDPTKQAGLCKRYYSQIRDDVTRSFPWGCAIARAMLAASAGAPLWGTEFAYQMPADCLRVLSLEPAAANVAPWRVEGQMIVTANPAPLLVRYLRRLDVPGAMDALLVTAIITRLAAELAMPLANDPALRDLLAGEAQAAMAAAQRVTATEGVHLTETPLKICNQALALLGQDPMLSLQDTGRQARLCGLFYDRCLSEVLRAHPWNCASRRATLTASATPPGWGFSTAYALPADCLRVLRVDTCDSGEVWKVEGRQILCNLPSTLSIIYIARIAEGLLDADVMAAVVGKLAVELALPVGASAGLRQQMLVEYQQRLRAARQADGAEGRLEPMDDGALIRARF